MKYPLFLLCLISMVLITVEAHGNEQTSDVYALPIASAEGEYVAVALTPEIYNQASLNSLRIVDSTNGLNLENPVENAVPFFIYDGFDYKDVFPVETSAEIIFSTESTDDETVLSLTGLKGHEGSLRNIKFIGVTLETEGTYDREVITQDGRTLRIYRYGFGDDVQSDTYIPYNGRPLDDQTTIRILDRDDNPIEITGVSGVYYTDWLVFKAEPDRQYSCVYGGELSKPMYDITNYEDLIMQEEPVKTTFTGEPELIAQAYKITEADYRWLFNTVVGVVAFLLISMTALSVHKRL